MPRESTHANQFQPEEGNREARSPEAENLDEAGDQERQSPNGRSMTIHNASISMTGINHRTVK
jgi:hypothetical protein